MADLQTPHVVLLTSPGAGHVRPVAALARCLATNHGFTATLISYTNLSSPTHSSILASLPPSITTTMLPEVSIDDLPEDSHMLTRVFTVVRRTLPHLRRVLSSLGDSSARGVAAFLADMLCPWALGVAAELGMPRYVFNTGNLTGLMLMLHLPELDRRSRCEYRDLPEPILLPGCVPLRGDDLFDEIQDRGNPVYSIMVDLGRQYLLADGFIVNTSDAIEHETISAFQELYKGVYKPMYPVGPLLCGTEDGATASSHDSLRWLDQQPGSGGTLSTEQTAQLAAGLEASGQRFLWVVRFPSDKDCAAAYFGCSNLKAKGDDPLSYLPDGFIDRNRAKGLVVPLWAPQVEILNHWAVGGFLSHCGWNSTLESAAAGVPIIAWPLFAEQRMNAVMLEQGVGMAVWPRPREDGIIPRDTVASVVKELMLGKTGDAARNKAQKVQTGSQGLGAGWAGSESAGGACCKLEAAKLIWIVNSYGELSYACPVI